MFKQQPQTLSIFMSRYKCNKNVSITVSDMACGGHQSIIHVTSYRCQTFFCISRPISLPTEDGSLENGKLIVRYYPGSDLIGSHAYSYM